MKREALVKAAFYMCKALGRPTSRREVSACIEHNYGKSFRPDFIATILKTLVGNQTGTGKELRLSPQPEIKIPINGTTTLAATEPATLELEVYNLDSESKDSSSGVAPQQPAVKATKAKREPRERTLPFDRPVLDCRNAILRAVWQRVQPLIGRTTTFTDWRKRNSVVAASFALGGFTPEQIVYAWEITTTRDGDPVRELFLVQRKMEQVSAAKALADQKAQARIAADAKRHYFTAPPPAPWDLPQENKA